MPDSFSTLSDAFAQSPALTSPTVLPSVPVFDTVALAKMVHDARGDLPEPYRVPYADHLLTRLKSGKFAHVLQQEITDKQSQGFDNEAVLLDAAKVGDTVIGAVTNWHKTSLRPAMATFSAVGTAISASFGGNEEERLPPLVTFAPTSFWGPHTINPAKAVPITGSKIGIVSMPWSYADQPLLWIALSHEIGGHDTLNRRPHLMHELRESFLHDAAFQKKTHGWNSAWCRFLEEATADVCGILGAGPAFAVSLIAWLAAVPRAGVTATPLGAATVGMSFFLRGGLINDDHPPDLLRLYSAIGVVEVLEHLSPATRKSWISRLEAVALEAAGGSKIIDTYDEAGALTRRYDLSTLAEAARAAGHHIATVKLASLGHKSIQSIKTWTDEDESQAEAVKAACIADQACATTPLHLIAGATLAVFTQGIAYDVASRWLLAELPG